MRIRAERVLSSELRVGDLFSTRGADYWNEHFPGSLDGPVGERVFIRTKGTPDPDDMDTPVYRLTVDPDVIHEVGPDTRDWGEEA